MRGAAGVLLALMLAGCASGPRGGVSPGVLELDAGPIWSDRDAQSKCPGVCGARGWEGAWRTTEPGVMSVCRCGYAGGPRAPGGPPTSCSAPGNATCAG